MSQAASQSVSQPASQSVSSQSASQSVSQPAGQPVSQSASQPVRQSVPNTLILIRHGGRKAEGKWIHATVLVYGMVLGAGVRWWGQVWMATKLCQIMPTNFKCIYHICSLVVFTMHSTHRPPTTHLAHPLNRRPPDVSDCMGSVWFGVTGICIYIYIYMYSYTYPPAPCGPPG